MRKVLTPPKRKKTKTSISSGYLSENAVIPVGAASKTNFVRWKKPNPVIKRTAKRK